MLSLAPDVSNPHASQCRWPPSAVICALTARCWVHRGADYQSRTEYSTFPDSCKDTQATQAQCVPTSAAPQQDLESPAAPLTPQDGKRDKGKTEVERRSGFHHLWLKYLPFTFLPKSTVRAFPGPWNGLGRYRLSGLNLPPS